MSEKKEPTSNPSFDKELIRDLASLLDETNLSEIEIELEHAGLKLRVARQLSGTVAVNPAPATMQAPVASAPKEATDTSPDGDYANHPGLVTSPMVGTIYMSAEPGAAPFVRVGTTVNEGDTLLIVEAMKTMNNIPAPKSGTVKAILVQNEQPIEFGEPLVVIE